MATATKKVLSEGLYHLLEEKPLDKITVKELTTRCGVNRQTFYYNFQDIFDLLEWMLNEENSNFHLMNLTMESWNSNLPLILEKMVEQRTVILNIYNSISRSALNYWFRKKLTPLFERAIEERLKGRHLPEEDRAFLMEITTMSFSGSLCQWIEGGMVFNGNDLSRRMEKLMILLDGTLDYLIGKLADEA